MKVLYDHANTIVKFATSGPKIVEIIIADKDVFLMIDPQADLPESSALWSNNNSLITALKACFTMFYKTS